eukprot:1192005-Prorocentrum_minimum.AAC.1
MSSANEKSLIEQKNFRHSRIWPSSLNNNNNNNNTGDVPVCDGDSENNYLLRVIIPACVCHQQSHQLVWQQFGSRADIAASANASGRSTPNGVDNINTSLKSVSGASVTTYYYLLRPEALASPPRAPQRINRDKTTLGQFLVDSRSILGDEGARLAISISTDPPRSFDESSRAGSIRASRSFRINSSTSLTSASSSSLSPPGRLGLPPCAPREGC